MRIDSSGNLLVGTTSYNADNVGFGVRGSDGLTYATRSGGASLIVNRTTSDGDIALFRKDGATVGSIGVEDGDVTIGKAGSGLQFRSSDPAIRAFNMTTNSPSDATVNLGRVNTRFKDLYLSGGVYLGGTGSANKISDYETGTWTPANAGNLTINTILNAKYTKIGDTVVLTCWFKANPTSTNIVLGPLPFSQIGRSTATWSNITQTQVISCQVVGNLIYGYGATSSGTNDDMFVSVTIHTS